jgi:hypothetical protein
MKQETLEKGIELNEQRMDLSEIVEDIYKSSKKENLVLNVRTQRGEHQFTIKIKSVVDEAIDLYLKMILDQLSKVELQIAELSDELVPEIPTDED